MYNICLHHLNLLPIRIPLWISYSFYEFDCKATNYLKSSSDRDLVDRFKFCCAQLIKEELSVFGSVHRKYQNIQQWWKGCQTRGWQIPFI